MYRTKFLIQTQIDFCFGFWFWVQTQNVSLESIIYLVLFLKDYDLNMIGWGQKILLLFDKRLFQDSQEDLKRI